MMFIKKKNQKYKDNRDYRDASIINQAREQGRATGVKTDRNTSHQFHALEYREKSENLKKFISLVKEKWNHKYVCHGFGLITL